MNILITVNQSARQLYCPIDKIFIPPNYKRKCLHHQLLVISNRSKQAFMQDMPRYVLYYWCVPRKNCLCVYYPSISNTGINIPQTNGLEMKLTIIYTCYFKSSYISQPKMYAPNTYMIIWSTEEVTIDIWIPREAITFFLVAFQKKVWVALPARICWNIVNVGSNILVYDRDTLPKIPRGVIDLSFTIMVHAVALKERKTICSYQVLTDVLCSRTLIHHLMASLWQSHKDSVACTGLCWLLLRD